MAYLCDTLYGTADGEDPFVHSRDNFADACFYTCLFPKLSDVLSGLANDDTGVLCANESTKGEDFIAGWGGRARVSVGSWSKIAGGKEVSKHTAETKREGREDIHASCFVGTSEDIVGVIEEEERAVGGGEEVRVADGWRVDGGESKDRDARKCKRAGHSPSASYFRKQRPCFVTGPGASHDIHKVIHRAFTAIHQSVHKKCSQLDKHDVQDIHQDKLSFLEVQNSIIFM